MKHWGAFLGVALGVSFVGAAATVVDFSQTRTNNWRVLMAAPSEMRVDAAGLHVQFDRAKMAKPEAPWAGLYAVERDRPVLTPGKVRVVMRYSEGGIVRTPGSLRIVDAEGEVFRYSPVERTRLDDRMLVTYNVIEGGQIGAFFAGRPKVGSTQGPKRNERFDLPIRLQEIAVGLEGNEKTGELVFERIETDDVHAAGDGAEVTLQVPGAEPQTVRFPTAARSGTTDVYELLLRGAEQGFDAARLAAGVSFTVKVFDDDGEGPDGWINLTDETEPMKVLCLK